MFQSTTVTTGGGSLSVACDVQIIANSSGAILQVSIVRDTLGLWQTSRCNEMFG
jgi:hypothetical protein